MVIRYALIVEAAILLLLAIVFSIASRNVYGKKSYLPFSMFMYSSSVYLFGIVIMMRYSGIFATLMAVIGLTAEYFILATFVFFIAALVAEKRSLMRAGNMVGALFLALAALRLIALCCFFLGSGALAERVTPLIRLLTAASSHAGTALFLFSSLALCLVHFRYRSRKEPDVSLAFVVVMLVVTALAAINPFLSLPESMRAFFFIERADGISIPAFVCVIENFILLIPALGYLAFFFTRLHRTFDELEQNRVELSNLLEKTKNDTRAMVRTMVRTLEERTPQTAGHGERVANSTAILAETLGYSKSELETIYKGALMHDIGLIGIPEEAIVKWTHLDADHGDQYRKHPAFGYDLLSYIHDFSSALDIVRYHHERYDGLGYPDGLKGKNIPEAARIVAICDVFDALTVENVYDMQLSIEEACRALLSLAGKQLDPDLTRIFVKRMREIYGIYEHESEENAV